MAYASHNTSAPLSLVARVTEILDQARESLAAWRVYRKTYASFLACRPAIWTIWASVAARSAASRSTRPTVKPAKGNRDICRKPPPFFGRSAAASPSSSLEAAAKRQAPRTGRGR